MERRDFFISYTKTDEDSAVWIAETLKKHGYSVYVQALDIHPGDNFLEKMEEFLENSANFIAVWSKNYSKSDYCMQEFRAAFQACHAKEMGCLLPVRVEKHPLKRLYSALVHADLFGKDKSAAEKALIDAVRHVIAPNDATTPEPPKPSPAELNLQETQNADDLYQTGENFYYGNGVEQNYVMARDYYEQAAAKGNADALNSLGWLYQNGYGVAQDYAKARYYYEQATKKGNAYALNNLGFLYQNGYGVEIDYAKARDYYEQAAKKGNDLALNNLGTLYYYGYGVEVEYAKARDYYEQAAKKGNANALNNLGWLYENGYGVEQDYNKALEYYQKAVDADAGNEIVANNLARLREKMNS